MARVKQNGKRKAEPKPSSTKSKKRKTLTTPEEWATFEMAQENVHFKREVDMENYLTPAKKWRCIMMENFDRCKTYAKKSSFVDHMRHEHRLNVPDAPRGRPLLPGNSRKEKSKSAKDLQNERVQSSWIKRVWRQKMHRCIKDIRGCVKNIDLCPKGTNKTEWLLQKTKDKYEKWRNSQEFIDTLDNLARNTRDFLKKRYPHLSARAIREKVNFYTPYFGFFICIWLQLYRSCNYSC